MKKVVDSRYMANLERLPIGGIGKIRYFGEGRVSAFPPPESPHHLPPPSRLPFSPIAKDKPAGASLKLVRK